MERALPVLAAETAKGVIKASKKANIPIRNSDFFDMVLIARRYQ